VRKIPTLFVRDPEDRKHVLDEVTPGCEWVLAGEGIPTRKYDGSCCMVRDGRLYRRHEMRFGKTAPDGYELVERDETTSKSYGWVPVGEDNADRWHREAWERLRSTRWVEAAKPPPNGTYELVGPKVQGNPESFPCHELVRHEEAQVLYDAPRTFDELRDYLTSDTLMIEGIVWRHPDGRMAKLKKRDFT
jgi:hypothetical protein